MQRINALPKPIVALLGILLIMGALVLTSCGNSQKTETQDSAKSEGQAQQTQQNESSDKSDKQKVRIASLKGPTSIGLVSLMDQAKQGKSSNNYEFTIATAADEISSGLFKGDYDIVLIPANMASVMYHKSDSTVSVIDINTLGVLNVVTGDTSVTSFSDLAGKTVYMTGKGAVPEYTMNYLLEQNGLAGNVTLEFKDEPTEVVSVLSKDSSAVGVLPQPFATAATTKNKDLKAVIDLNDVWEKAAGDDSQLITGVTLASKEFVHRNPEVVSTFLKEHADSVKAANDDPSAVAPLVVAEGIIDSEAVATKAIPDCHLVCITGKEMKTALSGYLKTMFNTDSSSVGGTLPGDDFYYVE